jgi:hypothetical protein
VVVGTPYLSGWTPSGYDAASRPLWSGCWVPVDPGARGDPFTVEWRYHP